MEKLGYPQTHLGLKAMIKEVDEDFDGFISYREFLLIFRQGIEFSFETVSPLESVPNVCFGSICYLQAV